VEIFSYIWENMSKKVALIILDWFGLTESNPDRNSIIQAKTPTFDYLFSKSYAKIKPSWRAVGLPDGQMWNSEVWHTTIWTGRIIKQSLVEISDLFDEWKFSDLEPFKEWIKHVRENGSSLHLLWLFGPGWVHSIDTHMTNMIKIIPSDVHVYIHFFLDWRDVPPQSAAWYMEEFEKFLRDYPNVKISTLGW
jgi:2,3-bisphosphoglycerate-independent phosphoglycerate mutase